MSFAFTGNQIPMLSKDNYDWPHESSGNFEERIADVLAKEMRKMCRSLSYGKKFKGIIKIRCNRFVPNHGYLE